jgi:AcrR family transcriptional regulator
VKVTRDDWLNAALDILVREGVAEVKILPLSLRLGVSRSSFYWYFQCRNDLLESLLHEWERRNTATILTHCNLPATTITEAVCKFFRCFLDPLLFDQGLDFAVREWARRDPAVRARIDTADQSRLDGIAAMYGRFGYSADDAIIRARILYFMQLGYHALDQNETIAERMALLPGYLRGFTGQDGSAEEIAALADFARSRHR